MRKAMIALLSLGVVIAISGCAKAPSNDATSNQDVTPVEESANTETVDDSEDANESAEVSLDANASLIKTVTGYDDDCCAGASETLKELNAGELAIFEIAPDRLYTYSAETVNGKIYYLEFSELGYLQVVRANNIDGEVIWGVID